MASASRKRNSKFSIYQADALEWLAQRAPKSIHAVVTDPPYGLLEYSPKQIAKLRSGRGGVWRIPPSADGVKRRPLPRFTVLTDIDKASLQSFFERFARVLLPAMVPGAHLFIATNPLVSHLAYCPMIAAGFEPRGEIIRIVHRLRGGDRPKNAHEEFKDVTVLPKSCWEPWGLFRRPCEGRVQDNLRKWGTGGLRRISDTEPFRDLIHSQPTRRSEHRLAPHPSLKPQHFLRQLVRASLPMGTGIVLDPFMGSGSTIAAAQFLGLESIGIEADPEYFEMATKAVPVLAGLAIPEVHANGSSKAVARGGGRTHAFGVKEPNKRRSACQVDRREDIRLLRGKPVQVDDK